MSLLHIASSCMRRKPFRYRGRVPKSWSRAYVTEIAPAQILTFFIHFPLFGAVGLHCKHTIILVQNLTTKHKKCYKLQENFVSWLPTEATYLDPNGGLPPPYLNLQNVPRFYTRFTPITYHIDWFFVML